VSRRPAVPEGAPARGAALWLTNLRRFECDGNGELNEYPDGMLCLFEDVEKLALEALLVLPPAVTPATGAEARGAGEEVECGCCGGLGGEHLHRPPCEGCYMRQGRPLPPPPAGPVSTLPAAEIGPQPGGQGPETRFLTADERERVGPDMARRLESRAREAFRRGIQVSLEEKDADLAAERRRTAEAAEAGERLAAEVERLAGDMENLATKINLRPTIAAACAESGEGARALLARLGFRPGQP